MSDKTVAEQMREQWENNAEWSILDEKVLVIRQDLLERWIKQIEEEKAHSFNKGMEWVRDEGWDYTRHNS